MPFLQFDSNKTAGRSKKRTNLKLNADFHIDFGMAFFPPRTPHVKRYKLFLFWSFVILIFTVIFDESVMYQTAFSRYLRSLKWTPLPLGVGFAVIAYQQYNHTRKREAARLGQLDPCDCLADDWEVQAYKFLPLKTVSRAWGWLTGLELPHWSRQTVLGLYVRSFGCNMAEAEVEDLNKYRSLSELFRRSLKEGVRPVDQTACVVSPADGTLLHLGPVSCGTMEQVKGVSYSLRKLLGPNNWKQGGLIVDNKAEDDECYQSSCISDPEANQLYHAIIYLAPGDYHRFHSPADWNICFRRHFPGELLSVNPSVAAWIRELFVLNERVCYVGNWTHGFFSMTPVGATNVGSIRVYHDEFLKTNEKYVPVHFLDKHFNCKNGISLKRGGAFGEFNLGSSIVMVFEAPKNLQPCVSPGQKLRVGQALYRLPDSFVDKMLSRREDEFAQR